MASTQGRRTGRRIAIALAIVLGLPAVVLGAALALLDSGAVTKQVMDAVLPRASAALGREVAVRGADLDLFPDPRVRLEGLTVAGRAGEPALVSGEAVEASVALWPLLASLGRDVEVRAVALDRPVIHLVRARDGTWNFEGLGAAGEAAPPTPAPAEPGGGARVVVQRFSIRGGAIRILDRSGGSDEAGIAAEAVDLEATGIGPGLPLAVRLGAAIASSERNLSADLSVSALPTGVPARPEDWPAVSGSLALRPLAIPRIAPLLPAGVSEMVRGGTLGLDAKVATEKGAYRLEGAGDLAGLRLRGQPASGRFRAVASAVPGRLEAARLEVREIAVRGPGVDLSGTASVEAAPLRARFALAGPLLDLDALMGALPPAAPEAEAAPEGGALLSAPMRREVRAAAVSGTLDLDELRSGKLRLTRVRARAVLRGGVLVLEDLSAGLYGGKLVGSGTRVALAEAEPSWSLAARLEGVDLGEAMRSVTGKAPLLGRTDGALELSGKGIDWAKLEKAMTGTAALAIKDGKLTTADLGAGALGAVAKALEAVGRTTTAEKVSGAEAHTAIRELAGRFVVADGWITAEKPFRLDTPAGPFELGGRVGLDQRLDLQGTVAVSRASLSRIVPESKLRLPETLTVPVSLGGSLGAPAVRFRAEEVAKALLRGKAEEAARAARQEAEKRTEAARKEAEAKAGAALEEARKKGAEAAKDLLRGLGKR
ncbi:MAG TPA: AsmA family protein [Anaeromyxobacteraceae bacterium]|nr:AsmA family protein [Anaeromyxobacteraceae bacterium]